MLITNLLRDGTTVFTGTYCLSKTPLIQYLQQPLNPAGLALSSATNALVLATTSQRSEAEKAAALGLATLFLCVIAKPLATRTTILLNPYAIVQLAAFQTLLQVTVYGLYKLAQHFTVSVSFDPTSADDIKKISVSELGTHKAELESSMVEKWDTFNLNMQAAFNVMLDENGQSTLPFTNYTRVAPLSAKELEVFQKFVGEHATKKEQSQVLFDHDLPPPKQFDFLPDPAPETASTSTLSPSQLLWYHQAFREKLAPIAQKDAFTLAFYEADLLPPSNAFFTSLPIPSSADKVSNVQAHYFVNYDHHHPEVFEKLTEDKQVVLNEIFTKAGKAPYLLKKPEEPPIESSSWSTAKKVMIYGGCALAVIALIAVPAYFLMHQATPVSPVQTNHTDEPCFPPIEEPAPTLPKSTLPQVDNSTICFPHEKPAASPFQSLSDDIPQENFRIDLSHLITPKYEPTPANQSISILYPSLESRYAVCTPDQEPLPPLIAPTVVRQEFPQEDTRFDFRHLITPKYEPTPANQSISLLYPSLESRYAVCSPDEKPTTSLTAPPVIRQEFPQDTRFDFRHLMKPKYEPNPANQSLSVLYPSLESRYTVLPIEETHILPPPFSPQDNFYLIDTSFNLRFTKSTRITPPNSNRIENPQPYSLNTLAFVAFPIVTAIVAIYDLFSNCAHRKHPAGSNSSTLVPYSPQRESTDGFNTVFKKVHTTACDTFNCFEEQLAKQT
ncbi:hypothetical protein [Simkania sp.]|uniref:hypothetical protein n=1 Tax=Simkania sp. TaxID=34094 RepID=UPI003B52E2C9